MWKKFDGPKVLRLSEDLVNEWVNMDPCPDDRPLNKNRLASHRESLQNGSLRSPEWAYARCRADGKTYRINGKHTSMLFKEVWDMVKDKNLEVVISGFDCSDLEEVASLYATYDSSVTVRTASDIYRVFANSRPDLREVPFAVIRLAIAGLAYHTLEGEMVNSKPADRARLLLQYPSYATWLHGVLGGATTSFRSRNDVTHLMKAPVAAAMARTWFKDQKDAGKFWKLVKEGSGPDHNSPDRVLRDFLVKVGLKSGGGHTNFKNLRRRPVVGSRELFVKCLHAWNAWRKGLTTNLKYHADSPIPAVR